MEFVNIRRVKTTLKQGELPAVETAKYLAAQGALWSVLLIPSPADAPVNWAFLTYPLLGLAGAYYCYRKNGGKLGRRLAERYLAIGWVVGWRFALVLASSLVAAAGVSLVMLGNLSWLEDPELANETTLVWLLIIALIYWRMGHHLADVQATTVSTDVA
jgi:hypothetical protein